VIELTPTTKTVIKIAAIAIVFTIRFMIPPNLDKAGSFYAPFETKSLPYVVLKEYTCENPK
jgi:hypothetical protein